MLRKALKKPVLYSAFPRENSETQDFRQKEDLKKSSLVPTIQRTRGKVEEKINALLNAKLLRDDLKRQYHACTLLRKKMISFTFFFNC